MISGELELRDHRNSDEFHHTQIIEMHICMRPSPPVCHSRGYDGAVYVLIAVDEDILITL